MLLVVAAILLLPYIQFFFFFNDPPPPEISPLPLHDALPFWRDDPDLELAADVRVGAGGLPVAADLHRDLARREQLVVLARRVGGVGPELGAGHHDVVLVRSEEHTSELQSQSNLVCRLLLEKK